jgi:hypothetical protein
VLHRHSHQRDTFTTQNKVRKQLEKLLDLETKAKRMLGTICGTKWYQLTDNAAGLQKLYEKAQKERGGILVYDTVEADLRHYVFRNWGGKLINILN